MFVRSAILIICLLFSIVVARTPPTVYLIRHGEKPANPDNHGLTSDGIKRAQCLRQVFGADSGYNIGYVMVPTVKGNGEHRRAYMTVLPLAEDQNLTIDSHCSRKDAQCVANTIRAYDGPGNILVAWRHKNIPDIQKMLGSEDPLQYPSDRFDLIWTIPYPFNNVTDITSQQCPGLDIRPGLVAQY